MGWPTSWCATALEVIGDREVRLDAQTGLRDWYASYGFVVTGPEFDEDGVFHVPMSASRGRNVVGLRQEAAMDDLELSRSAISPRCRAADGHGARPRAAAARPRQCSRRSTPWCRATSSSIGYVDMTGLVTAGVTVTPAATPQHRGHRPRPARAARRPVLPRRHALAAAPRAGRGVRQLPRTTRGRVVDRLPQRHRPRRPVQLRAGPASTSPPGNRGSWTWSAPRCSGWPANAPTPRLPATLTITERRILCDVAAGLQHAEIAEDYSVAVRTVRQHLGERLPQDSA